MNGPRNRLSVLPYRGPIVAGYQSGTPWVATENAAMLDGMLDFMLEAQEQFRFRNPDQVFGPWMHIYLQALWDCEQNGEIDTWVWDGPDGQPSMGRLAVSCVRLYGAYLVRRCKEGFKHPR